MNLPLDECDTLGHLSYPVSDAVGHDGVCRSNSIWARVAPCGVCFVDGWLAYGWVFGY